MSVTHFIRGAHMRLLIAVFIILQSAVVIAAGTGRPTGNNCDVSEPPESAGEDFNHGGVIRVYPRAKDINEKYTGCQTTWLPDKEKWLIVSMVAIEFGYPIRIWAPSIPGPIPANCTYKKGKLRKGDAKSCPDAKSLTVKSLDPGCGEKIKLAVAAGLGAQMPSGCKYE